MDLDTQDKAKKLMDQLTASTTRGGKAAQLSSDQIKLLSNHIKGLSAAASEAAKVQRELGREFETVNRAFSAPSDTFVELMDRGVETGEDLLKTFGAIAGLAFAGPIEDANKELQKQQDLLNSLPVPKSGDDSIKLGNDEIKNLEEKLKKEKDLCDKTSKCNKSEIADLEKKLQKEELSIKELEKTIPIDKEHEKHLKDQYDKQVNNVKKAQDQVEKLAKQSEMVKKLIAQFGDAFDRFVELDKAAAEFRRELGLGRDAARPLEQMALQLNQQFVSLGVSIKQAYQAMAALGKTFGTALLINKELAQTTTLLAANYGVNEQHAAGFLQKMGAIGGMTDKQASAMAGFTANLANAAGVNIDEVMGDVANASDETLTLMRGNVKQMTFAAIQAKMLGVSLDKTASSAKGLLNFSQSVSDEMEASVLLGKNLNLNYARQLSFAGDVAGAQKEILNQVKSMGEFSKMNTFQQEALAKATGYSVADLTKMLANEEKLSKLSEKERASYDKALESFKEQNEETGKQLLMRTQMQSAMVQLSNTFKSFKQIIADILTPVVNVAVKLLIPVLLSLIHI